MFSIYCFVSEANFPSLTGGLNGWCLNEAVLNICALCVKFAFCALSLGDVSWTIAIVQFSKMQNA